MKHTAIAPPADDTDPKAGLAQERFGFTVFLSVCVHVVLIIGVGFSYTAQPRASTSLEVTLASYRSAQAPQQADFLAQANQQGSGTLDQALAPASPAQSPFNAEDNTELADFLVERPTRPPGMREVVATPGTGANTGAIAPDQPLDLHNLNPQQANSSIASLRAQLDLHRQEYAKRPRRYTLTSAATREAEDALYLDTWRKRIETIGNQNYPEEATTAGIYGTLRVLVALNPDGSVNDIRILRSSGERVLDEAAIRIVQLAAPFDPFSTAMRQRMDVLEIIRTWQFQRGDTFTSF